MLLAALLGVFCLEGDCRPLERLPARVAPADRARTFVWIDAGRKNAIAGTIAANDEKVPHRAATHATTVSVRLSDEPSAPVPVTIELVSPERTWSFSVPVTSKLALALSHPLSHPSCDCTLRARAEEYRNGTATLDPKGTSLLLRRLPAIRGVVLDAQTSSPLAGAEVTIPGGSSRVVTGANGAFRIVVDETWPAQLQVTHALRAPKLVPMPKTIADTELPPILLTAGGTLQLTIAPPIGGKEPLLWELHRDDARTAVARSGTLESGASTAQIASLDAGVYRLLIKGREPLQQHVSKLRILDGQMTETNVAIAPLLVEGSVTFDGVPLASPTVVVAAHDRAWEAKLTADRDGRFVEELWQPGRYSVSVKREPLVRIWGTTASLEGDGRVPLELRIPNRLIRGRVAEGKTGAPIGDVMVIATVPFGDGSRVRNRTRTGGDGTFEFSGVEAGDIELTATRQGYRFGPPIRFVLREDEALHEERLVLEQLPIGRTIAATDARGLPIVGAAVVAAAVPGEWEWVASTDTNGRATVHAATADERAMVFVIPRSGSLGFAPLAGEESSVVTVRVLDTASLEVRMESVDGKPIAAASVRMRINGTVIPAAVIERMAHLQGVPLFTDASGRLSLPRMPPGQYDLQPRVSKSEQRDPDAPQPPGPVSVTVLPGPQTVVMKFTAK